MTFVASIRFDNGKIKYKNISADSEIDACWVSRDYAKSEGAELVNVTHARSAAQNRRSRPLAGPVG